MFQTYFRTIFKIDKKSTFICIIYNLLKQLLNVFYGVYFLRLILVHVETDRNLTAVLWVLLGMLAINVAFHFGDQYFKNVYTPVFQTKLEQYLYETISDRAADVPYDQYCQPEFLNLYQRLLDNTAKNILQVWNSIGTLFGLVEAFVLIWFYIGKVDWFAIVLSVLPLFYSYVVGAKGAKYRHAFNQALTFPTRKKEYAKRVFYLPQYAKELRTTSVFQIVQSIYEAGVSETIAICRKFGKKIGFLNFVELLISDGLVIMLPIAYVVVRILTGHMLLIGDFIGIAQSITTFGWDLEWFFDELIAIKEASLYIREYQEYCETYQKTETGDRHLDCSNGFELSFVDVGYSYQKGTDAKRALHDVNVTIRNGEVIAVVGENGAGKTTFTNLLSGLFVGKEGEILLNGTEISQYTKADLTKFFGVIHQDFHLFPMSVRDNIRAGEELSEEEIQNAVNQLEVRKKIRNLDQSISREFADDGLVLSGGESQQLMLARIIANRYPFVILDEPTSALDPLTERKINRYVMQTLASPERTILFISHRLFTTQLADRILVFDKGTIVEEGNHCELMEKKGHYYEMYQLQQKLYGQEEIESAKTENDRPE